MSNVEEQATYFKVSPYCEDSLHFRNPGTSTAFVSSPLTRRLHQAASTFEPNTYCPLLPSSSRTSEVHLPSISPPSTVSRTSDIPSPSPFHSLEQTAQAPGLLRSPQRRVRSNHRQIPLPACTQSVSPSLSTEFTISESEARNMSMLTRTFSKLWRKKKHEDDTNDTSVVAELPASCNTSTFQLRERPTGATSRGKKKRQNLQKSMVWGSARRMTRSLSKFQGMDPPSTKSHSVRPTMIRSLFSPLKAKTGKTNSCLTNASSITKSPPRRPTMTATPTIKHTLLSGTTKTVVPSPGNVSKASCRYQRAETLMIVNGHTEVDPSPSYEALLQSSKLAICRRSTCFLSSPAQCSTSLTTSLRLGQSRSMPMVDLTKKEKGGESDAADSFAASSETISSLPQKAPEKKLAPRSNAAARSRSTLLPPETISTLDSSHATATSGSTLTDLTSSLKRHTLLKASHGETFSAALSQPEAEHSANPFARLITSSPRYHPADSTPLKSQSVFTSEATFALSATKTADTLDDKENLMPFNTSTTEVKSSCHSVVDRRKINASPIIATNFTRFVTSKQFSETSVATTIPSLPLNPNVTSLSGSTLFSPGFTHVEPPSIAKDECLVEHAPAPEERIAAMDTDFFALPPTVLTELDELDALNDDEMEEAATFIASLPRKETLPPHPALKAVYQAETTCSIRLDKSPESMTIATNSSTAIFHHISQKLESTSPAQPPLSQKYGFIPEMLPEDAGKLTLVLDLDETLVHCSIGKLDPCDLTFELQVPGRPGPPLEVSVRWRPHLFTFLEHVRDSYEVILFTASQRIYADTLLDLMDPERRAIRHRLFRESCRFVNGNFIKDLDVLDRELARTVIVDNAPQAYGYHVSNGYPITSWYDNPNDTALLRLVQFLSTHLSGVSDVRPVLSRVFPLDACVHHYRELYARPLYLPCSEDSPKLATSVTSPSQRQEKPDTTKKLMLMTVLPKKSPAVAV